MKILMITTGFPPVLYSENICNGKLALALKEQNHDIEVISRIDSGPSYDTNWSFPFDSLKDNLYQIDYEKGNFFLRIYDIFKSNLHLKSGLREGIRWAFRAYKKALELMNTNNYDAVLTRSPNEISHFVGYALKKKTGVKWIANWNDPVQIIWPDKQSEFSKKKLKKEHTIIENIIYNADINTFPSDSLRQHYFSHFPDLKNKRTNILPHIGLVDRFWPQNISIKKEKLTFLHSGNLTGERDPELLFKSFRNIIDGINFSSFEFHILGHIADFVKDLIKKYNLENYIKCIDSLGYYDSIKLMMGYDVLVVLEAKLKNGIFYPSKLTDYFQAKKPILAISPQEGFVAHMLKDIPGYYVTNNESLESIYENLIKIISKWQSNKLENNILEYTNEMVAPPTVVNKLISIINE